VALLPVLAMFVATAMSRPAGAADAAAHLVGLVEIPAVLGDSAAPTHHSVTLRTAASETSPIACVVGTPNDLETREHGYEELSAVVYDTKPGWYRIRCHSNGGTFAWLAAADGGTFHSLEELVQHGLAYLTAEWDRSLYQRPRRTAASHRVRVVAQQPDIAVADTVVVDGELWLLVIVYGEGRCTAEEPAPVLDAGWTPAHSLGGALTAWFYSRGC
jgi:hypothetical protein